MISMRIQHRTALFFGVVLCLLICPSVGVSQDSTSVDSLQRGADSLALAQTTEDVHYDSTGMMRTPQLVGTLDRHMDSSYVITRDRLDWMFFRYIGEVLAWTPGVQVREQFSIGSNSAVSIRGQDWRSVAVTMNGRLLNDPASGTYTPYYLAPEYADRIEVVTGLRAFLYGLNGGGAVINMVTKNYNSNRPFSKINFSEGGYNEQYSDGTFSQNISRKVNITLGFQHQSADPRFFNSQTLAWNARGKIRYEVSRNLNVILSEYYTSTNTRLNGGVDVGNLITQAAFLPQIAPVRSSEAYEKVNRHDVDLSFVGTFLGDTSQVTTVTLYYSNSLREYRDAATGISPADTLPVAADHRSSWMGMLFTQNFELPWQQLNVGATVELRQIEGSPTLGRRRNVVSSAWGKDEITVLHPLVLAGYVRFDQTEGRSYVGAGADAHLHFSRAISVYGGFSFSRRLPTYQELYWNGNAVGRTGTLEAERHRTVEAGTLFNVPDIVTGRVTFFHRVATHPIVAAGFSAPGPFTGVLFTQSSAITTNGIEAALTIRPWILTIEGAGTFMIQRNDSTLRRYPRFSGIGGIYFWNSLFNGNLNLKIGFRGRISTEQDGVQYNPEVSAYADNTGPTIHTGSSVDAVLAARFGDATIHLLWENLLNNQYFLTPYYPVYDRAVRFGISWQFLD